MKIVKLISRAIKKFTLLIAWASFHLSFIFFLCCTLPETKTRLDRWRRRSKFNWNSAHDAISNVHQKSNFTNFFSLCDDIFTPDRCPPRHRWRSLKSSQFHLLAPSIQPKPRFVYPLGIDFMNGAQFTRRTTDDQSQKLFNFSNILFMLKRARRIRAIQTVVEHVHEWWLSFNSEEAKQEEENFIVINGQLSWTPLCYDGRTSSEPTTNKKLLCFARISTDREPQQRKVFLALATDQSMINWSSWVVSLRFDSTHSRPAWHDSSSSSLWGKCRRTEVGGSLKKAERKQQCDKDVNRILEEKSATHQQIHRESWLGSASEEVRKNWFMWYRRSGASRESNWANRVGKWEISEKSHAGIWMLWRQKIHWIKNLTWAASAQLW